MGVVSAEVSINLIGDINILNTDGTPKDSQNLNLYEGDQMIFDVQVNTNSSQQQEVYVAMGGHYTPVGDDRISDCILTETINEDTWNYHCELTIGPGNDMYGERSFQVEAKICENHPLSSCYDNAYLGNYFLNPLDLFSFEEITSYETENVVITPKSRGGTPSHPASYTINDPRFIWNGTSFVWQTNKTDSGDYTFRITLRDTWYEDSEEINIKIMDNCKPSTRTRDGSGYLCYYPIGDEEPVRITATTISSF